MNKKEKSAWAIFFTSVALSFVFVSLLSFKGCGCNSGGSGGSHPKGSGGSHPKGSGGSHPKGSGGSHPKGSGGSHPKGSGGSHPKGSGGSHPKGSGGSHPTGSGGLHPTGSGRVYPDEVCVEKDDFFQCPEVLSLVSALKGAKSKKDELKVENEIWSFVLKGARYLKPEHDSNLEQLAKKSPPNSLIDVYRRAVSMLGVSLVENVKTPNKTNLILENMAVAGASLKEGVFREASKEEEKKYKKLSLDLFIANIVPDFSNMNLQEYKKYRLIEDHNFESTGSLSPHSNGDIFYIEKFPTINLWFETEKEKDLALKGRQLAPNYELFPMFALLKKSELLSADSPKKYADAIEKKMAPLKLEPFQKEMRKIGDVPPKKGSNLRELWVYSFALKAETENIPLAGSFYLVKIHVG